MREGEKWGKERGEGGREEGEGSEERTKRERERGSPYLASVEYKLNEMHDDASTDVLHAELLPKLMTHREGYSWLNEFLDEQEGEGEEKEEEGEGEEKEQKGEGEEGREGGRGGGGRGREGGRRGRGRCPTKLRCSCAQRICYLQLAQGGLQPTLDGGIESGAVFV